jgi:excisionase family DNA binding protein
MNSISQFITINQAAEILNLTRAGICKHLKDGDLEYLKLGQHRQSRIRITVDEIQRFLKVNTVPRKSASDETRN